MTSFLAKHPLLAGTILLLVQVPLLLAVVPPDRYGYQNAMDFLYRAAGQHMVAWGGGHMALGAVAAFLVALCRRRHGFSAGIVYGLMPMALVQLLIQLALVTYPPQAVYKCLRVLCGFGPIAVWSVPASAAGCMGSLGILVGIMLANVLANHLVRTGRWHITPREDAVVREEIAGLMGNIIGLAKRRRGRSSTWMISFVSLAATYPLGAGSVALAAVLPIMVVADLVQAGIQNPLSSTGPLLALVYLGLIAIVPAIAGVVLSLLRRRSGLSVALLVWLVPVAAYQTVMQSSLLLAFARELQDSMYALRYPLAFGAGGYYRILVRTLGSDVVYEVPVWAIVLLPALGALAGLLVGTLIARRCLRSGRWETIVPVDRPRGGS